MTLVLIGDPKQAIYAFRGADVYAYLEAADRGRAPARRSMSTGAATSALIDGARRAVRRRPARPPGDRLPAGAGRAGAPAAAPARRAQAPRCAAGRASRPRRRRSKLTRGGHAEAPSRARYVAKDLAADVVELLSAGRRDRAPGRRRRRARVRAGRARGHRGPRPLAPQRRSDPGGARRPRASRRSSTAPAACSRPPAAGDWLALLRRSSGPRSPPARSAAALTPLLGWSAERIARAGEADLEQLHQRLHGWARVLRLRGIAALAEAIVARRAAPGARAAHAGRRARLTDLQHVAQLLHAAATSEQLGPPR